MDIDPESLRRQIPAYLPAADQRLFLQELERFGQGEAVDFYIPTARDPYTEDMLQGDGWRGFQLFFFDNGEKRDVRGLVFSNSCDVDPANPRPLPTKVTFAPMVKLEAYRTALLRAGLPEQSVTSRINDAKAQKVTNIFFLPAYGPGADEYIVRLDDVHSMPTEVHSKAQQRQKLFTLSMIGFYLFVLKLTYHFCRLQEAVARKPTDLNLV
jgi:hypothetical protein